MKNIATAAIIATAALCTIDAVGVSATAKAGGRAGLINGYRVTVIDSGRMDRADSIQAYGPNGVELITVTCAPFDWNSYGANSATWVDRIAESWCFGG